ncbi:GntR family transcriptional regulator [Sporosarcina sp. CAU 1771]
MFPIGEKVYLRDVAYLKIKDLIIRDELSGPVVSENELATLLNMSRTPIREALNRLQNESFLEIYPKRGIYIKDVTVEETIDIMNMRLAIELFSMNIIPDLFQDRDLEFLEKSIVEQQAAAKAEDVYEFIKLDLDYHEHLLKIAGNEYFVKTLHNITDRIFHTGIKIFKRDLTRMQTSINDHILINEKLKNKDFVEARNAMEEHIARGKKLYLLR